VTARLLPFLLLLPQLADAQALATPRLACEVVELADSTTITARDKGGGEPVVFQIAWERGSEKAVGFRADPATAGAITSTHRVGTTTITRTILASETADCILVHVIADQPGAVSLTAGFVTEKPVATRDRREILLSGEKTHAHTWIIPFESDVGDAGKRVSIRGEGEALIILNLTADPVGFPVSGTLSRLGDKYDPGHKPANPHLIWEGIRKAHAAEGDRK
jgi:hypothetical protein